MTKLIFLLALLAAAAWWTANEASYVLTMLLHHPVAMNWFFGLLLNLVSCGVAFPFDVITFVLRSMGVI